jgi:TolB-like protein/tetratricopeptide (TPR) repeat protein
VAILPFQAQAGDALTKAAAEGMGDEMARVLNGAQFVSIAADQTADLRGPDRRAALARLHVAFLMDGSVTHEGNTLRAQVRLDDARDGATVWSGSSTGPDSDPAALETDVASRAVGMAFWARSARLSPGGNVDAAVMAQYLKSVDDILSGGGNPGASGVIQARALLQSVVAQAPGFARGRGGLALVDALVSHLAGPDQRDSLVRDAREEAEKSKRLDPHSAEPYQALFDAEPGRNWVERERIALQGIAVEPGFPYLTGAWGWFLARAGRTREAIDWFQRALALNPLHIRNNYRYGAVLADSGQIDAAKTQFDDTFRLQPAGWTDLARLSHAILYGTPREGKAALDRSAAHPYPGESPALAAWAAFLKARQSGGAADKAAAAAALKRAMDQRDLPPEDVIPALAVLGDIDGAFEQLNSVEKAFDANTTEYLFAPATAPLRSDPRFWAFAARTGLIRYWRTTGHWPDVCSGPGALDCKAMAAAAPA